MLYTFIRLKDGTHQSSYANPKKTGEFILSLKENIIDLKIFDDPQNYNNNNLSFYFSSNLQAQEFADANNRIYNNSLVNRGRFLYVEEISYSQSAELIAAVVNSGGEIY